MNVKKIEMTSQLSQFPYAILKIHFYSLPLVTKQGLRSRFQFFVASATQICKFW